MITSISKWMGLLLLLGCTRAGYLSVNTTTATQCGTSIVRWSGDTGPYHLLLTPTEFKEHGYNVWIESIPDGINSYELTIRQPQGLQYMLTVWGSSGIQYAATTDVLTVQPSPNNNSTCFLSDDAILNLYTFSFNLTSNSGSYPPQCSNISLTWPSSLESNVTSDYIPENQTSSSILSPSFSVSPTSSSIRSLPPRQTPLDTLSNPSTLELEIFDERDESSSEHNGNTTHPPTMFGIIPLGNSFSIPISYNKKSKYAKYLPESSLSENPTTFTYQGTTHLNWTVDMAKGTRFILVAGIGSQEKWASGGSSSMFTVGQGGSGCIGSEQNGGGAPSVTATTGSPTGTGEPGNSPGPTTRGNGLVRTIVACVASIIGTLVIVGFIFMCRRARNRRRLRGDMMVGGGPNKKVGNVKIIASDQYTTNSETPLDLIASRDDLQTNPPRLSPLVLGANVNNGIGNRHEASTPISPINPFEDTPSKQPLLHSGPSRSTTLDGDSMGTWSSLPISPIGGNGNVMMRHPSQDALLSSEEGFDRSGTGNRNHNYNNHQDSSIGTGTGTYQSSRSGPLQLHSSQQFDTSNIDEEEDINDLKRDTIAYLGEGQGQGASNQNHRGGGGRAQSINSAPPGNRRRRQQPQQREQEVEFRIHRDAGRVIPNSGNEQENNNIMELPPRYDEVNWEEEREREERDRQTR